MYSFTTVFTEIRLSETSIFSVIVKTGMVDSFVLTAYLADTFKKGAVQWEGRS